MIVSHRYGLFRGVGLVHLVRNGVRPAARTGLLLGDVGPAASETGSEPRLDYFSNRAGAPPRVLAPGVYGLSNAGLDTPWPKAITSSPPTRVTTPR